MVKEHLKFKGASFQSSSFELITMARLHVYLIHIPSYNVGQWMRTVGITVGMLNLSYAMLYYAGYS